MKNVNAIFLGVAIVILGLIPLCKNLKGRNTGVDLPGSEFENASEDTTEIPTTEVSNEKTTEVPTTESLNTQESDDGSTGELNEKFSLFNCETKNNEWDEFCEERYDVKDNIGQKHNRSMIFSFGHANGLKELTAILNKKYTTLDIPVMYLPNRWKDSKGEIRLEFYDQDGNELNYNHVNITKEGEPESCSVDVTGVKYLKIKVAGDHCSDILEIGVDEAWLY